MHDVRVGSMLWPYSCGRTRCLVMHMHSPHLLAEAVIGGAYDMHVVKYGYLPCLTSSDSHY